MALPEQEMSRLRRRGFWLEYASMAWMTVEAAVAIVSGILTSSTALIGFGLDSVIEFFAAVVVVWQLRGTVGGERESRALRLIGGTFFALAAYLTVESITDLVSGHRPEQSTAGIVATAAALVVMPLLALAKRRTGPAAGQPSPDRGRGRKRVLRLHLRRRPDRHRAQRLARLVVSRPRRRPGHRRPGRQGRHRSLGIRRRLTGVRTHRRSWREGREFGPCRRIRRL